jgi:small subunit ribosomal protein S1
MTMSTQKVVGGEPPSLDEGWWASLLAEEDRTRAPAPARKPKTVEKPVEMEKRVVMDDATHLPPVDWNRIKDLYQRDAIVDLKVAGFNRGGLLVQSDDLHGFVPFSHLIGLVGTDPVERDHLLQEYVGQELHLKVIECVPEDGRVVFSERAAQAEPGQRSKIFSSLQAGQRVTGTVTNVTDFGAFVDLGGVEGLIHISELSWGRVIHPSHIVQLGQDVEALVLDIAAERCRVALSLKRLSPNPWEHAAEEFAVNAIFPATITTVLSYGAFARLDAGIEGLIHASEMPIEEGQPVKQYLNEGQRVNVKILHIDSSHQRMGLSMRVDD